MAKPTIDPIADWATDTTWNSPGEPWHGLATTAEPLPAATASGYTPGRLLPAQVWNWILKIVSLWLTYLSRVLNGDEPLEPDAPIEIGGDGVLITGTPSIRPGIQYGRVSSGIDADITIDPLTYAVWIASSLTADRIWTLPDPSTAAMNNRVVTVVNLDPTQTIQVTFSGSIYGGGGAGGTGTVALRRAMGEAYSATFRAFGSAWIVDRAEYYGPPNVGITEELEVFGELSVEGEITVTGDASIQAAVEWGRQTTGTDANITIDPTAYAIYSTSATANRVWTLPDPTTVLNRSVILSNAASSYYVTLTGATIIGHQSLRLSKSGYYDVCLRASGSGWYVEWMSSATGTQSTGLNSDHTLDVTAFSSFSATVGHLTGSRNWSLPDVTLSYGRQIVVSNYGQTYYARVPIGGGAYVYLRNVGGSPYSVTLIADPATADWRAIAYGMSANTPYVPPNTDWNVDATYRRIHARGLTASRVWTLPDPASWASTEIEIIAPSASYLITWTGSYPPVLPSGGAPSLGSATTRYARVVLRAMLDDAGSTWQWRVIDWVIAP